MADKKNKIHLKNFYRYLPGTALAILTIFLIFFFKSQSNRNIIEAGRSNINEFVANNLKPLISKTKISREDLFNFAVYKNLPVDKQNGSMLFIGSNPNGDEFVELKEDIFNPDTRNYDKFKHYLSLNQKQNIQLDSIVDSYEDEVYESILFNDEKAVAVNPKIKAVQQALLTDLTLFANHINPQRSQRFIKQNIVKGEAERLRMLAHHYRKEEIPEYIVFTPDTVVTSNFEIKNSTGKNDKINWDDIVVVNKPVPNEIPKIIKPISVNKENHEFYPRVVLPQLDKYFIEEKDTLFKAINASAAQMQNLQFLLDIDSTDNSFTFKISTNNSDSIFSVGFDINTEELGNIINTAVSASASSAIDWENFGIKMDSLARVIEGHYSDTSWLKDSTHFDFKEFKKELEEKRKKKKK